jgi:hypothetical protein
MDEMQFYWMVFAAVVFAFWTIITQIRTSKLQQQERNSSMVSRLLDFDRLCIEHPEIQQYLAETSMKEKEYFRLPERLKEKIFFQAKSHVYAKLNVMDEIVATGKSSKIRELFLGPSALNQLSDWETYFRVILRHPLYRSIMEDKEESKIFGATLRDFYKSKGPKSADAGTGKPNPFIW